jgi:hypothetical protein
MEDNYTVEMTRGFTAGVTGRYMSDDTLNKEEWTALYYDRENALIYCTYASYERATKRHGWQTIVRWGFTDSRNNTTSHASEIPVLLKEMMLEKFRNSIVLLEKRERE